MNLDNRTIKTVTIIKILSLFCCNS